MQTLKQTMLYTLKGWEVIQRIYTNQTDVFYAVKGGETLKDENGEDLICKTQTELYNIINSRY